MWEERAVLQKAPSLSCVNKTSHFLSPTFPHLSLVTIILNCPWGTPVSCRLAGAHPWRFCDTYEMLHEPLAWSSSNCNIGSLAMMAYHCKAGLCPDEKEVPRKSTWNRKWGHCPPKIWKGVLCQQVPRGQGVNTSCFDQFNKESH